MPYWKPSQMTSQVLATAQSQKIRFSSITQLATTIIIMIIERVVVRLFFSLNVTVSVVTDTFLNPSVKTDMTDLQQPVSLIAMFRFNLRCRRLGEKPADGVDYSTGLFQTQLKTATGVTIQDKGRIGFYRNPDMDCVILIFYIPCHPCSLSVHHSYRSNIFQPCRS